MATTINLGTADNPETDIPDQGKVNFKNTTGVGVTLTTEQGINPPGSRDLASGATSTDFTISGNKNAILNYSWDDTGSRKRATRGGTIKVT
jgi:hypothetical protein